MTEAPLRASIVIVTRDRALRLRAALESLEAQTVDAGDYEVVVVDDGSSAPTPALIEQRDGCTYLRVDDRPGLGALRNLGWRAGAGELVCFIDDDCEADPGWLEALLAAAAANPGSGVQGHTVPIERELESAGPLTRSKLIESAGPWYQTCNIAYPRQLLDRLGGFDESLRTVGEDTDLGWRAIESGASIVYESRALAAHAVERIGFQGWLEVARRERLIAPLLARHPRLAAQVRTAGVFKGPNQALFVLAMFGLFASRRNGFAAIFLLPYLRLVAARCKAVRAGPHWGPWFVLYDAVALTSSARGALASRAPLI